MVTMLRPHVMIWSTPAGEATFDPITEYPIPGTPGSEQITPCRFHDSMGRGKVYKNEDSTESVQVGTIRLDAGVDLPSKGSMVVVKDEDERVIYEGTVKEVPYRGTMSSRVEV